MGPLFQQRQPHLGDPAIGRGREPEQDQLVAAFRAWACEKDRPLAQHLLARDDLDADQLDAVEAMVTLNMKKHGGLPEQSLAAIHAGRTTSLSPARADTAEIVATLAATKRPDQWLVGFALETEDHRFRAIAKLQRKSCDLIVVNGATAIGSPANSVEILDRSGVFVGAVTGPKEDVARGIFAIIAERLIDRK